MGGVCGIAAVGRGASSESNRCVVSSEGRRRRYHIVCFQIHRRGETGAPEKERENITSADLAQEIMEEILSRLPVKSLLRFRCVSKSWLSLISSERFIEAHHQNSTKIGAFSHHKVIFQCEEGVFKKCSLQELLNESSSLKPCRIHDSKNNELLRGADVVGCCNGLLCLYDYQRQRSLFLWNPATMIFMELPYLKGLRYAKFGFGWDGTSDAYMVFAASSTPRGISKGNVYSSKTNSLKTVEHGCLGEYNRIGVFVCGKIHWIIQIKGEDYYYIESFDLESEEFGRIELPPQPFHRHYKLAEIGGCLHLLCVHERQSYVVVWVMKEESGWLELFSLPIVFELRYINYHTLLGGGPNGEIVFVFENNYLVYSPKRGVLKAVRIRNRLYEGFVYVESLVSPNFTTTS